MENTKSLLIWKMPIVMGNLHDSDTLREALLRDIAFRRLSQAEYARAIGETVDRMKNAMSGRSDKGLKEICDKARKHFNLPESWPGSPMPQLTRTPMRAIPVVGSASAGPGASDHADAEPLLIPSDMCDEMTVGWSIQGDSMYPWLREHDIVAAQPVKRAIYGKAHIVRLMPSQEVAVKFVHAGPTGPELRSVNPQYPPVQNVPFEIVGLVTGLYRANPRPATGTLAAHDPSGLMPEFFSGFFTPPLD